MKKPSKFVTMLSIFLLGLYVIPDESQADDFGVIGINQTLDQNVFNYTNTSISPPNDCLSMELRNNTSGAFSIVGSNFPNVPIGSSHAVVIRFDSTGQVLGSKTAELYMYNAFCSVGPGPGPVWTKTIPLSGVVDSQAGGNLLKIITYAYDDLNRLTAVAHAFGPTQNYTYDSVGNITSRVRNNPDTDGDGLLDIAEINVYLTNPILADTDQDGLTDGEEVNIYHTDPTNPDTDGDGVNDGAEVAAGTDPLNPPSASVADGDLNSDGVVNAADILLAQRIVLGQLTPTLSQLQHGDVAPLINGIPAPDGQFNVGDLLVISRKALGQINF